MHVYIMLIYVLYWYFDMFKSRMLMKLIELCIHLYEGRPLLPVKEFRSTVKTNMSRKGNCSPRKAGDRTAKDMCQPRLTYNVHNT